MLSLWRGLGLALGSASALYDYARFLCFPDLLLKFPQLV